MGTEMRLNKPHLGYLSVDNLVGFIRPEPFCVPSPTGLGRRAAQLESCCNANNIEGSVPNGAVGLNIQHDFCPF